SISSGSKENLASAPYIFLDKVKCFSNTFAPAIYAPIEEMEEYVSGISFISKTLKTPVDKNDLIKYQNMKTIFEKSIVAKKNLEKGHIINREDIDFKKPGNGIRADKYKIVLGKKLKKNLLKDEKIHFEYLES
ncbi:unnamed protein product, partial [marine sediment metagenome]